MSKSSRILPQIAVSEVIRLLPHTKRRRFEAGERILQEGTKAHSCFLVLSGRVKISKRLKGKVSYDLATIKKGDFFGEMAMLSGQPRSATAIAVSVTEVLEIKRADFLSLLKTQDPFAARLSLHFSSALALRCSRLLQLLAKSSGDRLVNKKKPVDVRQVLHRVYSLWAV